MSIKWEDLGLLKRPEAVLSDTEVIVDALKCYEVFLTDCSLRAREMEEPERSSLLQIISVLSLRTRELIQERKQWPDYSAT